MPEKNTVKDRLQKMGTGMPVVYFINNINILCLCLKNLGLIPTNTSLCLFLPQITTKSANLRHNP